MIIVLVGATSSGKSTIENELATKYGYEKIVSYTTRKPRDNEIDGKDYHFISNKQFRRMMDKGLFAEHEEYSQGRFYGTPMHDYKDYGDYVVVLTPNGLRQLKRRIDRPISTLFTVYINSNIGTRGKRYIEMVGVNNFKNSDMDELAARSNRDWGIFLGIENEVDLVVENNEGTDISEIVKEIINFVR